MEADRDAFHLYKSGVVTNISCGIALDHAVLAVGYSIDKATKLGFWKVKNSWTTSWGEEGYIRLHRDGANAGKGGMCGILMDSSYPVL